MMPLNQRNFEPDRNMMEAKPGTYALVMQSTDSVCVQIGRWGQLSVQPGYYIYVGSAFGPGGVSARVSRHCRRTKTKHWHIDYLREVAILTSVWYSHAAVRLEHRWADALSRMRGLVPVAGFGCTDCNCGTHLVFSPKAPQMAAFSRRVRCAVQSWTCGPP